MPDDQRTRRAAIATLWALGGLFAVGTPLYLIDPSNPLTQVIGYVFLIVGVSGSGSVKQWFALRRARRHEPDDQ